MTGKFEATFGDDGDWRLHLPTDADKHDVLALGPVIDGLRAFAAPAVDSRGNEQSPTMDSSAAIGLDEQPIGYCLVEKLDPPNLTA